MIPLDRLIALALGESDDDADEHVLACGACAETLERLLRIGDGVRALITAGRVSVVAPSALADELDRAGLLSRHHRLRPGEVVPCRVAAADLFSASHFEAPLATATRVDLVRTTPAGSHRYVDVPFDAARGVVHLITRADAIRKLPSTRLEFQLIAVDPDGEHTIARYTLDHTAT